MMRLLSMTGLLGLLLGLMLLPMGCSGSEGETTSDPSLPRVNPAWIPKEVEVDFALDSDGRSTVSGLLLGYGEHTGGPADSGSSPEATSTGSDMQVLGRWVHVSAPSRVDGARARLSFEIRIDDETKVFDRSGNEIRLSEVEHALGTSHDWTATLRLGDDGPITALELRQLKRLDARAPLPVVTGLLGNHPDGLLTVPGEPRAAGYEPNGKRRVKMTQHVFNRFGGLPAKVVCSLAVDDHSEVVMIPQREGSMDELPKWVNTAEANDFKWRATARLEEDGTLTLVKLVGSPLPGN